MPDVPPPVNRTVAAVGGLWSAGRTTVTRTSV